MRKNMSLAVFALAVVLLLFFLSSRKKPPVIPADDLHKRAATNAACAECHSPGKKAALNENHPPKEQCVICHVRK